GRSPRLPGPWTSRWFPLARPRAASLDTGAPVARRPGGRSARDSCGAMAVDRSSDARDVPLVSVIVNNFNYERYVGQAIESALGQTYPHVEVIVVDDGSQDASRTVIEGFGDRVIALLKENGGQGSAFNVG